MKKLLFVLLPVFLFACKGEPKTETSNEAAVEVAEGETANFTPSQKLGKEIFEVKGLCSTCHKPDQKMAGPSLEEIARVYKEKGGNMVAFLEGKSNPLVDPSQYEIMKANILVTKNYPDEELVALQDYIMTFGK